ncbi:MAG: hypothetical protein PSW75_03455 [bacterium]|nr:hypothetical protein [bacterium]MDI1334815.1 hypothetical protein [Lacunisphaera sp.]
MDWVSDHLQIIIAAAGAVAWWLKQRTEAQDGGAETPPREDITFEDPALAERTRRIREEIQRKIEQRAKGYATEEPKVIRPAPAVPTPLVRQVVVTRAPEPPVLSRAATARLEAERSAEILEQQKTLMEKLRAADELKAAAQKRTEFEAQLSVKETDNATARGELRDEMRDPAALRRAFILREVLGPPVALR